MTHRGIAVCCGFALHTGWPRLERSALLPENSVLHCFLNGKTLTGSIPHKKQPYKMYDCFLVTHRGIAVCCGFALHTDWPRLESSALLPENSVPHCFLNGKTLTGSIPHKKQPYKMYDCFLVTHRGIEPLFSP